MNKWILSILYAANETARSPETHGFGNGRFFSGFAGSEAKHLAVALCPDYVLDFALLFPFTGELCQLLRNVFHVRVAENAVHMTF